MRFTSLAFVGALGAAAIAAAACGSSSDSEFGNTPGSSGDPGSSGVLGTSGGPGTGSNPALDVDAASLRIDPADAVIELAPGATQTKEYKIFAKLKSNPSQEIDVTGRSVFYVPDNYLVGGFPLDGKPTFTTRAGTANAPQRGGKLTVQATIANSDKNETSTTSLTVHLTAAIATTGSGVDPAAAATKFNGGTPDATKNPVLAYPNDGTMLPPNLRRLEVHWRPGAGADANSIYEISFTSASGNITYYGKCDGGITNPTLVAGACGFELDEAGYGYLAESNRGQGGVKLKVRRADATGTGIGASNEFNIEFAENRVDGGLYYWDVTNTRIMRFDFGAATGVATEFAKNGSCMGCHAISRDGKKIVASLNGQGGGQLVFSNDVSTVSSTNNASFTQFNNADNRSQFASFNPDGSRFVSVYGDDGAKMSLYFADGNTGLRIPAETMTLTFRPDHPEWSPNGNTIAMTSVPSQTSTSQMPGSAGNELSIMAMNKKAGGGWDTPFVVIPQVAGKSRFNPNFAPDSSFFYYSESSCTADPVGERDPNGICNGDSDSSATTWAVKPVAGATPVKLTKSATRGVADLDATIPKTGQGNNASVFSTTGDTFPRSAPFQTNHRGGKLFWFTAASRRQAGLRQTSGPQHLYMFAVDPAKVLAGQDGSYTSFYLPFQDLNTSNHIGQWTEKIVGGTEPPPAPPPPPPPAPAPPIVN